MSHNMKRLAVTSAVAVLLLAGGLAAKEEAPKTGHPRITDPEVYIPLREEMTRMEMKFVDLQIMAAGDQVDYKAVQAAIDKMEAAAKKIRAVNPSETLREPLEKLSSQIEGLGRDARRKDRVALKADLDRMFETCFKCHQTHAPLM